MPQSENLQHQFASFFPTEALKLLACDLWTALAKGSICIDSHNIDDETLKKQWITSNLAEPLPFAEANGKQYLFRYFRYQEIILNKIRELTAPEVQIPAERVAALVKNPGLKHLSDTIDIQRVVDWQTVAAVMAYLSDFSIITGGPGTGKTTTLAKVLTLILSEKQDAIIKMAAPTGKAAKRMEQALQNNTMVPHSLKERVQSMKATTIHRLLGTIHLSPSFKHSSDNPLRADVVIVDEASMVDVALFAKLMSAIGANTRLILLGDQNQLASVEAGSLFGDICGAVIQQNKLSKSLIDRLNECLPELQTQQIEVMKGGISLQDKLIVLQHSYRFQNDHLIALVSKEIIAGKEEKVREILVENHNSAQMVFDQAYDQVLFEDFIAGYQDYIHEPDTKMALKKLERLRVLAAVRMGKRGIYELNKQIEKYLANKGFIKPTTEFYENRPILITKNYYELNLFNGDIGIVRQGNAWFSDELGELRNVSPGLIAEVETAFAMTIHKSQGSEFDRVLMILPDKVESEILTRELIYTGTTRAKSYVLIQSTLEVMLAAVKRQVSRASGLREKLINNQ